MENLYRLQEEKFREIIPHILATPFYTDKLLKPGAGIESIHLLKDLTSLPFTYKEELRNSSPLERTPYSIDRVEYFFSSSGTTGAATIYFWTEEDDEVLREASIRAMQRVSISTDDVALVLAPTGLPVIGYCAVQQFKSVGAGVIALGVRSPEEIIRTMTSLPVSIVFTLPVGATRLFEYLLPQRQEWPKPSRLRQFQCGGDFLSERRRRRIEQVWNVECYDFFGMSEIFGPFAGECQYKQGMHILSDYIFIEVLDPETQKPVQDGHPGVAVYTTLWKKGTPLLRYWSDDFILIDSEPCPCGRLSPRMRFVGRPTDMTILNGRRLFASQLEEEVLAFPVSNEYELKLLDGPRAILVIEELPGTEVPLRELQQCLSSFLDIPVEVQVVALGDLPRDIPKPKRIQDQRSTTEIHKKG